MLELDLEILRFIRHQLVLAASWLQVLWQEALPRLLRHQLALSASWLQVLWEGALPRLLRHQLVPSASWLQVLWEEALPRLLCVSGGEGIMLHPDLGISRFGLR